MITELRARCEFNLPITNLLSKKTLDVSSNMFENVR